MREEELGTYQMLWDCPVCDTEKLLGLDHRHCPNCGAAQDPTRRYFPAEDQKIAVKDHPFTGADVICPACESPCARAAHNCPNCGSPLDEGKEVARRQDQSAEAGLGFAADTAKSAKDEHDARRKAEKAARDQPAPQPEKPRSRVGRWIVLGLIAVVVLVVVVFGWKKPVEVEATGHTWTRSVAIEEFRPVSDSAWRDQVPFGAYDVSCHREQRSSKQVPDGESCSDVRRDQGNGTFKVVRECRTKYRSEPIYDDRCTYRVNRWTQVRTERADGASIKDEPRWPAVHLAREGSCIGCQREGARTAEYQVTFKILPSGKEDRCTFDQPKWASFQPGGRWPAEVRVVGGGLDCGTVGRGK